MIGTLLRAMRADPARSPLNWPGLQAPESIRITSPSFVDGAPIPARHAGRGVGDNVSPELNWTGIPYGTRQLALILDDIDVPLRTPLVHSIAVLDPDTNGLTAGEFTTDHARIIPTMLSKIGYSGPRPIPGHGPHRYRFHLLALDRSVPSEVDSPRQLFRTAAGNVIARGTLTGSYER